MAIVNISEAAKLAGCGRATIYRRIAKGDLSKTEMLDGTPGIDTAELLRVFGTINMSDNTSVSTGHIETGNEQQLRQEIASLRELLKVKDELLGAREDHIADLQQSLRLLEHRPAADPTTKLEKEVNVLKKEFRFLGLRLFGGDGHK